LVWNTKTHFLECNNDTSIRAILHDEHTYPEPLKFNPERFENEEKNRLSGVNDLPQAAFGFGRRWVLVLRPMDL
jgi:hypothetical protein